MIGKIFKKTVYAMVRIMSQRMGFLAAAENRETFFKRISLLYPTSDERYQLIEKAYQTAKDAFRRVKRDNGKRYFEHLRHVALIMIDYLFISDHLLIAAALLHDIVEDIPSWTTERVRREFGEEVGKLVDWMTKRDKDSYHESFARAKREFFLIKLADRWDNVLDLWECVPEKIERKITETRQYYLPYARRELILANELEAALVNLENNRCSWNEKSKKGRKINIKKKRRNGKK